MPGYRWIYLWQTGEVANEVEDFGDVSDVKEGERRGSLEHFHSGEF